MNRLIQTSLVLALVGCGAMSPPLQGETLFTTSGVPFVAPKHDPEFHKPLGKPLPGFLLLAPTLNVGDDKL